MGWQTYYSTLSEKMNNLTIHCLHGGQDEATIKTLMGAAALTKKLTCGDGTGSDRIKAYCRAHAVKYLRMTYDENISLFHNELIASGDTPWHLHLCPGEKVIDTNRLSEAVAGEPNAYRVPVLKGDWLTKEIRLHHRSLGCKFSYPVFENIVFNKSLFSEIYIVGDNQPPSHDTGTLLRAWAKRQPLALEPRYYMALGHLTEGRLSEFLNAAQSYLFADPAGGQANTMLRYYLACGMATQPKTRREAVRHVLTCLASNILMAEFWCLLGDICRADGSYDKAKPMYRNAIVLGGRRLKDDGWPMQISKYKKHPNAMTGECEEAASQSRIIRTGP